MLTLGPESKIPELVGWFLSEAPRGSLAPSSSQRPVILGAPQGVEASSISIFTRLSSLSESVRSPSSSFCKGPSHWWCHQGDDRQVGKEISPGNFFCRCCAKDPQPGGPSRPAPASGFQAGQAEGRGQQSGVGATRRGREPVDVCLPSLKAPGASQDRLCDGQPPTPRHTGPL